MYNQHTRGMATTRHRSLVAWLRGAEKRPLLETKALHKKIKETKTISGKPDIRESKEKDSST